MTYYLRKYETQAEADQAWKDQEDRKEAKLLADLEQDRKRAREWTAACPIRMADEAFRARDMYKRYMRRELNMEMIREWGHDHIYIQMGIDYPLPLEHYKRERDAAIVAKHGSEKAYKQSLEREWRAAVHRSRKRAGFI